MDTAYKVAYIAVFGTIKVLSYSFGSLETELQTEHSKSKSIPTCSEHLLHKQPVKPPQRKSITCKKIYYHSDRKNSNKNTFFTRRRSTGATRTLQTIPETEAVFSFRSRPRTQSLPERISKRL